MIRFVRLGKFILHFDQQPIVLSGPRPTKADQSEFAAQLAAVQCKLQAAGIDALADRLRLRFRGENVVVRAMVPNIHCAGAILAFGNRALELGIVERMVFDVDG